MNIETLTMGDLIARARLLTMAEDQSQEIAVAVHTFCSGVTPPPKSDPISSVTCYRCSNKGNTAKDCWNCRIHCYWCGEVGHWAQDFLGNETRTRHQLQLFPPPRCECGTPSGKHLCQQDTVHPVMDFQAQSSHWHVHGQCRCLRS